MKYTLPKKYLSYSSLSLWKKDKNNFRRKYYEGVKDRDTSYTVFGKEVHELIAKDEKYSHIRLPVFEQKISIEVKGIPVMGYIDTFNPKTYEYMEYKSGIAKAGGSPRWTQLEVEKHDQLPFYSFLIQEKYGAKVNNTFLVWLETRFKDNNFVINGVKLGGERELELTGRLEMFERRLFQRDRDQMKDWVITSAQEISRDYQDWLKNK